jgi:hypothetical protein
MLGDSRKIIIPKSGDFPVILAGFGIFYFLEIPYTDVIINQLVFTV